MAHLATATPMAGLATLSIIPDSSSSAAATPMLEASMSSTTHADGAQPAVADRAKRVYGGAKRIFQLPVHRAPSPLDETPVAAGSTLTEAERAERGEVVPETVESGMGLGGFSPPRTAASSESGKGGRSSPSPSGRVGGDRRPLLPGLALAATTTMSKTVEDDSDSPSDDEDDEDEAPVAKTSYKSALREQLAKIDAASSSPPRDDITSLKQRSRPSFAPEPILIAPLLQPNVSSSDLSSVPPSTAPEAADTSLETQPTSPNEDNESVAMQESFSQVPLSHAAKKSKGKKARIIDSDSESDAAPTADAEDDELPTLDQTFGDAAKRAKRKKELEEKAAAMQAAQEAEAAVKRKDGKKKMEGPVSDADDGMEPEADASEKKKKRKAKGLNKKEQEETRRDIAALERRKEFIGITSGTRDLSTNLSAFLAGQRQASSAAEASRSRKAASVLDSKFAVLKQPNSVWSGGPEEQSSSPIDNDWSSQPQRHGKHIVELDSSNLSSQVDEGRAQPEVVELRGSSEDDSDSDLDLAPAAPSRNVARDIYPLPKSKATATAAQKAKADDYDSDELPEGDTLFEDLQKKEAQDQEAKKRREKLDAIKAHALAQERQAASSSDDDLDIEIVAPPTTGRKSGKSAVCGSTPKASHTHLDTKGAETLKRFADKNHQRPLRHDSQGHLTESMLLSNSQMQNLGRAVHLRGEEKPSNRPSLGGPLKSGASSSRRPAGKNIVKPTLNVFNESLAAKARRDNARISRHKQDEWLKKGGRLAAEKAKLDSAPTEVDDVKAALERTKQRRDEDNDLDEDADDESWQGEDEEEEDLEMDELSGASEDDAGSGSGEDEQGSGSEDEDDDAEEDEEDEKMSDTASPLDGNDENAPPMSDGRIFGNSGTQSIPSLVPTVVERGSGDRPASPSASQDVPNQRRPLSQIDGYVSPPATPPASAGDDTSPVFGQLPLPGFALPMARSDAGTSVTEDSQLQTVGFLGETAGSAPAGGFTQFFGADFTQAHGKRVGQLGFAQQSLADIQHHEADQCLLPGVDVLPEELERDAVRLGDAAMFREATPVDDRPELYLNDEGLLTQHKPKQKTPEATPMSQITMRIPFGLLKEDTMSTLRDEESQSLAPPSIARPRRLFRAEESAPALDPDHAPPPQQRQRRPTEDIDENDATSLNPDDTESASEMPPPKLPVNGLALLMEKSRAPPAGPQERKDKKGKRKFASELVADAASESEDEVYGKMGGGDEEDDDDDSDAASVIENLVDDAQVDAETRAKEDELAAAKARLDQEADEEKLQKQAEAMAKGQLRRKQARKSGFEDSDDDDDEEHVRNEFNRRHENKRQKVRDDIQALGNDERTAAFANAYKETTAVEIQADDHLFLSAEPMALDPDDEDDDSDGYGDDDVAANGLFADQVQGKTSRKRPIMDSWDFDDQPAEGIVLAGPSSSPQAEIQYSLHNHTSRNNSYGGADRNFTRGGGNHDDLDTQYDSQRYSVFDARIMSLTHELGGDDHNAGRAGAGKGSAITSMVTRTKVVGSRTSSSSSSNGALKGARADLMQPNKNARAGSLQNLRKPSKGVPPKGKAKR